MRGGDQRWAVFRRKAERMNFTPSKISNADLSLLTLCYTSHCLKSRSCESPALVNKMLEVAQAPCRRKLSSGHRPGELLLT